MADSVRKVNYFSMAISNKAGEGLKVLSVLAEEGVNLLGFSGFPRGQRAQLDFIPEDAKKFAAVVKKAGWAMNPKKVGFLLQGDDRAGVLLDGLQKLAGADIKVTAMDAVVGGDGRYGALLWVKPENVVKAAKLLGAK